MYIYVKARVYVYNHYQARIQGGGARSPAGALTWSSEGGEIGGGHYLAIIAKSA